MQVTPILSLRLLGPFEATRTRPALQIALRRQTRAVLAYLAASGQPLLRQALADMFCQEVNDPPRALRSILSRIRQRLGPNVLLTAGNTVQFNHAVAWLDCQEFARMLAADLTTLALGTLAHTVDLYRGAFLEDVTLGSSPEFELWLLNERTRYQRLYERGLETLVARLVAQGELESAIARAQALVHSNPLLEEAHARLMWLYARSGQREAALAQYQQCRQLLRRELAVEPTPELVVLREEIAAGQLSSPRPLRVAARDVALLTRQPSDFVGRTGELAQLHQVWEVSRPGATIVVLLDAEAGMGKTRLVHEFAATLPEATFLIGACSESTRAVAYAPWLDVLTTRLGQLDDATLQHLSTFAIDYLTRLLPNLARRLGHSPPPSPTSGDELNRLFTAIGELLLELPKPPPLLLFIDNLQWADDASLQLFYFLARRSPPGKFLLISALRTEDLGDSPALQSLISDLQRQLLLHLLVPPLSPRAITELTAQLWPSLPGGYRPHICEMLIKATGGNPLFVSEILRELAHMIEVPSALPVPKSVGELVQRRLSALPDSSRQVLEAMAVLDAPATPAQAQQTSGRSEDETISAIDMALRRGFLQTQAEAGPAWYAFSHDIIREAVLGQLSHIRRQVLHRRAALALERAGATAATLAYHWQMAGNVEKEGHYAALAGEQAAAIYANEEAVRYLERALQLIAEPKRRISVTCRLGEVWQLLGRQQEAVAMYRQALVLTESVADQRAQARCQVALGRLMRLRGDYAGALTWLEMARAAYEALDDQQGLAQTLGGMGAVYWSQLDYPRALTCFRKQLEIAHRLGDRRGIGAAVGSMGVVYTEQGDYAEALACYAQRFQIDMKLNDRLSLAKTIGNMGILYADQGEYANALACCHCLLRMTLELGDRQNVCVAVGNMISIYAAQGKYALAERLSQQAIALGRALNIPLYLCEYLHVSTELLARKGRYAEACSLNDEAINMIAQIGRTDIQLPAHLLSFRLRLAMGEVSTAEATRELESLLNVGGEDHQQAAILYELWRLDNRRVSCQQRAAELYRRLYARTSKIIYRHCYEELAGEALPGSPSLPTPPEVVVSSMVDLETLLVQVDRLIADLDKGSSL
jgi:DNA-binding SARP family transcriptional activator